MRAVAEALHIPVIANGGSLELKTYQDMLLFRVCCMCKLLAYVRMYVCACVHVCMCAGMSAHGCTSEGLCFFQSHPVCVAYQDRCGASSVMLARSAQSNMSIFNPEGTALAMYCACCEWLCAAWYVSYGPSLSVHLLLLLSTRAERAAGGQHKIP
jgi:tRNA-dihydrouridine synthase